MHWGHLPKILTWDDSKIHKIEEAWAFFEAVDILPLKNKIINSLSDDLGYLCNLLMVPNTDIDVK